MEKVIGSALQGIALLQILSRKLYVPLVNTWLALVETLALGQGIKIDSYKLLFALLKGIFFK
jgi:hypothetical protein